MNPQPSGIVVEKSDGVLLLRIDNEKARNAMNTAMYQNLRQALIRAESDREVLCVFLTGTGKAFCAGQDLKEVIGEDAVSVENILRDYLVPLVRQIRSLSKPVICGVNGLAVGAGFSLALAGDLMLVSEDAKFQLAFSKIGLIPDAGGTYFLVKSLGAHRSAALMLLDRPLNAQTAVDLGLAAEMFPQDSFESDCRNFLSKFTQTSMSAAAQAKTLINQALYADAETQLEAENKAQTNLSASLDHAEGVKAFLEKRPAVFNQ